MSHIRFFYSNKGLLNSLKKEFNNESNKDLNAKKNILQLDFCLDYPLESLKEESLDYFIQSCNKCENAKEFSSLEYFDLLDSIFFLVASNFNFETESTMLFDSLNALRNTIKINDDDELKNYSKIYLLILVDYLLNKNFDKNIILDNKNVLENLFDQFKGLIDADCKKLYDVVAVDLTNINRMKSLYLDDDKSSKTNGYQDFSNMYATIGKITFWKMLGLGIDDEIINEKFMDEFNKSFSFFNF
ncbi:hypothetical protein [Xylocopilactobacillus apicola]|uniref:dUTPase n=1 Tax=Xylocopilactobacillus apicola TaxID=2932184 RepID=A0AAU9DCX0_9LACO|nr:hypothetical protein [Xylocopilactobacillus apicola]BDR57645.1 hypothetical protein XA3_00860 [Xylocopilactobacillus apicola]